MPTPTKGPRLGGSAAHERIILANLASQLFEHGAVVTTEAKAKRVRPLAEKMITKAKRGDLHARRVVLKTITDPSVVHVLFTEIAPAMEGRDGGYTRITKIGNRQGDNAPMAKIEVITEPVAAKGEPTTTESAEEIKAAVAEAAADEAAEPQIAEDEVIEAESVEAESAQPEAAVEAEVEETTEAAPKADEKA